MVDPTPSRIWQVAELTHRIQGLLEDEFPEVRVEGEISNFSRPASGHCYFTLKDEDAQLDCVLWRWQAEQLSFAPEDGLLVRARGGISVYPPRGQYQLKVEAMQPVGEGELQKAFERLKEKLGEEGLFEEAHKRPLPEFPRTIGVVTSGTGAALHDILSTLSRRFPLARVQVRPTRVQGEGAYREIVRAIRAFNRRSDRPDVLIVGRGGGSIEDLWAFNEEPVARAVFASAIPVISAVGHETDYSIADFVADRRAATPSMAAELAVPDQRDVRSFLEIRRDRLERNVRRYLDRRRRIRMLTDSHRFRRPVDRVGRLIQRIDELSTSLDRGVEHVLRGRRDQVERHVDHLRVLDPRQPLRRGYAWITEGDRPVRRAARLSEGDHVRLRFIDGERRARVEDGREGPQ